MAPNSYVTIIKEVISSRVIEADDSKIDLDFFDDLFDEVKKEIRTVAKVLRYPEVDDDKLKSYFEVAKREYLSINPVDIEPASALTKENKETWLTSKRTESIAWNYTDRYIKILEASGRSDAVVNETKVSSLDIMSRLGDPKSPDEFYIKGLVVGEVQSGKTGNFNGVINRAIDSGYKLIIVLSGIMEDLRSQTQQRIEADIVGEGIDLDTTQNVTKGVGKISRFGHLGGSDIEQVVSITSFKTDFKKGLADTNFSLNHTNILVCKKNIGVLRNLVVGSKGTEVLKH